MFVRVVLVRRVELFTESTVQCLTTVPLVNYHPTQSHESLEQQLRRNIASKELNKETEFGTAASSSAHVAADQSSLQATAHAHTSALASLAQAANTAGGMGVGGSRMPSGPFVGLGLLRDFPTVPQASGTKRTWTSEEDEILRYLVEKEYGAKHWSAVSGFAR